MRISLWVGFLILCGIVSPLGAADIQYELATGDVVAAKDTSIPAVDGYGVITIPEAVSAIQWPHPAGCTSAGMRYQWITITNAGIVDVTGAGMAIRAAIEPFLFSSTSPALTTCAYVGSWKELRTLIREIVVTQTQESELIEALNYHTGWYYARCDDAPTNQNCLDWKAQLNTVITLYPSRVQGISASTALATLVTDANAFRNAQCASQPGGPFC